MSRKKFYLVLDTETCNTIEQPLPYDIGWTVCDKHGNIYARRSYVVKEVFFDMADVMQSAYYVEKIPRYVEEIRDGQRVVAGMWEIRRKMREDIKAFKIREVGAYNMAFDKRALNNLIRYVSKSWARWWFPYGVEFFCIWNMACSVILNRKSYIDFAERNGFISEAHNLSTSAENAYRYIKNRIDFLENHTGLEDVEIEVEIMAECYRQKKKMCKEINPSCWRKVQRKRREMDLREAFK